MKHELSLPYLLLQPFLERLPRELQCLNSDHVVMVTLVTLFFIIFLPLAGRRFGSENRGALQQAFEAAYEGIRGLVCSNVHVNARRHFAIIATFATTIVIFNTMGNLPFLTSPTPYLSTTAALAITSFVYYNLQGFREHGFIGYMKTFMGPIAVLAPIMLASELISHLARILSLSVRLAGSMGADHVVLGAFTYMVPLVVPAPMMALGLLMAFLQTFIFILLSTIYLGGAVSEEH